MPNWIEGTLKLRGSNENLKRFFDNAVQSRSCHYDEEFNEVELMEDTWIKDTKRAFVNGECYIYWEKEYATVCIPIMQAWCFVTEEWVEISKQYNLDVRLYGFEQGMEFCQEVEIIDGKVTMDNNIRYDDWDWECPMPRMGG